MKETFTYPCSPPKHAHVFSYGISSNKWSRHFEIEMQSACANLFTGENKMVRPELLETWSNNRSVTIARYQYDRLQY